MVQSSKGNSLPLDKQLPVGEKSDIIQELLLNQ